MVKAKSPGRLPASVLQNLQKSEGLNTKEAQQAKQSKAQKLSSSDAARMASQAGFQRLGKKGKKGFDVGDGSSQQYALPDDELDPEVWTQEGLESAQGSLSLAASQFGELSDGPDNISMGAAVVGSSYMPTEEDLEEMELLARRKPKQPLPMLDEVSNSVQQFFGIQLDEDVPVGHKVLAAGLLVAGEQESVKVDNGKLGEKELAGGVEKVTKRGNQAVGEAQRMNKGVEENLHVQRTFMFRR